MCNCITQMPDQLRKFNLALDLPLMVNGGQSQRMIIATRKINSQKRGKVPLLFATHCPFCGEEYGDKIPLREKQSNQGAS